MRKRYCRPILATIALFAAAACASLPTAAGDTSVEFEPPPGWDAAVAFRMSSERDAMRWGYAVRVNFFDGVRNRRVGSHEVLDTPFIMPRTPWYRVRPGAALPTVLHVTVEHGGGVRTVVDYPIPVRPDELYLFSIGVGTRDPEMPGRGPPSPGLRGYPINPAAHRAPTDSLWITYDKGGRYCFDCPR